MCTCVAEYVSCTTVACILFYQSLTPFLCTSSVCVLVGSPYSVVLFRFLQGGCILNTLLPVFDGGIVLMC